MTENHTIAIVGGAGGMGRHAARGLKRLGVSARVVIADLNVEAAKLLADEIGDNAVAFELDVTDEKTMAQLFASCSVVVNTMGPFARYGTPILRAALENGCDYLDIDDDWQSTVEALGFDTYARDHGRTVVIGLGASPGTTNVCARVAAELLDQVDDLFTGWSLASAVIEPEEQFPVHGSAAAAKHWLHQCSAPIRAWNNYERSDIAPLQEVTFTFPGIGHTFAYTMGHPEAVTLPLAYPTLRSSLNLQCGPRELFTELGAVVRAVHDGNLTAEEAAAMVDSSERGGATPDSGAEQNSGEALPDIWALARGVKNSTPTTVAVYPTSELPGKMGGHTGIPLAIGVALLLDGKLSGPGVHAPETAFEPDDFFHLYKELTLDPEKSGQVLAIVEEPRH